MDLLMRRRALMGNLEKDEIIATSSDSGLIRTFLNQLYNNGYCASPDILYKSEAANYPANVTLQLPGFYNANADWTICQWFTKCTSMYFGSGGGKYNKNFAILPPSITTFGNWMCNYDGVTRLVCTSTIPPTSISQYAFGYDTATGKIYVPDKCYDAYVVKLKTITNFASGVIIYKHSDLTEEERAKIQVITYN